MIYINVYIIRMININEYILRIRHIIPVFYTVYKILRILFLFLNGQPITQGKNLLFPFLRCEAKIKLINYKLY